MKALRSTAAVIILAAACFSSGSCANEQTVQRNGGDSKTCVARTNRGATCAGTTSKPQVISVGVSDPDTQLNLPWFLTDIINAINTHESASDLLHRIGSGF